MCYLLYYDLSPILFFKLCIQLNLEICLVEKTPKEIVVEIEEDIPEEVVEEEVTGTVEDNEIENSEQETGEIIVPEI